MSTSTIDRGIGELTGRERFRRAMHFLSVDRVPHWEFGYWEETIQRWHGEGLPAHLDDDWTVEAYFGVEPVRWTPVNHGLCPPFEGEPEVIEERATSRVERLPDGTVQEVQTDGALTIPHFIKMPIANREEWQRFKERLDPEDPRRFQTDYAALGRELLRSGVPVSIDIGSYYGIPRNWMGFEGISLRLFDDRELVEEVVATLAACIHRQLEEALKHVEVDMAHGWEDICFRNGPMISPQMFREICGPHIKRTCDLLRQNGCDVIWTDCDGDVTKLIPVWLDCGLNCMFPVEVRGGSDPVAIREQYGRQVLLRGGYDKTVMADGKGAILAELRRIAPVVEQGGYIPHGDHRIPKNVSYEDYKYYIREKLAVLGWRDDEVAQVEGLKG